MMDFSNAFTGGAGAGKPKLPFANKPKLSSRTALAPKTKSSRTSKPPQVKRFGTPVVKTTRAMELRRNKNLTKNNEMDRFKPSGLETIREDTYGKYIKV